jgi:hypothetical protein
VSRYQFNVADKATRSPNDVVENWSSPPSNRSSHHDVFVIDL